MNFASMDKKDKEIIHILKENARLSYSDIGKKVSLSRTAVKNRITALEEKGIIKGYGAIIGAENQDQQMTFLLNAETRPESFEEVKNFLVNAKEVVTVFQTTGKCHLNAICTTSGMEEMKTFVTKLYDCAKGIEYIQANAVIDVPKGSVLPK